MQQTTELSLDPTLAAVAPKETQQPRASRMLVAVVVLQLLLGGGLALFSLRATQRLDALGARAEADAASAVRTQGQLEGLSTQAKAMQAEVAELRQAVSSHAREETLFLKALILKPSLDPELARRIARSVQEECALHGRDPNLVLAIMAIESDFNPKAVSYQGAVGLMQVMPHWRKVLGIQGELEEPEVSIRAGIQILGFYQEMYRDPQMALTAYNRGPGPVDASLMRGASPANGYDAKVLATWERLKRLDTTSRP